MAPADAPGASSRIGTSLAWAATTLCALLALAPARADVRTPSDAPAVFTKDCGSCHVAFPPQLMRGEDWRRLLAGLQRHFGTDASVSPLELKELSEFIGRHAAADTDTRRASESGRVSATAWFQREHREVADDVWKHAEVGRPSNCGACHTTAEQGRFGHRVRMPGQAAR